MINRYSLRRDNLISPWGIGAIVPFPHDESLMVAGLDYWFDESHSYRDFIIIDERLSKRMGGKQFVAPPDFRDRQQDREHAEMRIPAVRFPLWHYCPVCGNMEQLGAAEQRRRCSGDNRRAGGKETYCSKNKNSGIQLPYLVPERFIAVCPKGHIEDFPIMKWVHEKSKMTYDPQTCKLFRSTGGKSSSLAGIKYTCTCGASANMSGAFGQGSLSQISHYCTGNRPWLGSDQNVECNDPLLVLQRGSSNVWFADVISSVYIPTTERPTNEETKRCIKDGLKICEQKSADIEINEDFIRGYVKSRKEYEPGIDAALVFDVIAENILNRDKYLSVTEDNYRKQEYDVLTTTTGTTESELFVKNFSVEKYENLNFLKSISLVHKLRETRVFKGFSRISPDDSSPAQISVEDIPWLPAIKNSGEGIMFEFDYDKLLSWTTQKKVVDRASRIENNLKRSERLTEEVLNPAYVLLHTFAHCLINALSCESGYSNASIRERIYCPKYIYEYAPKMSGVLIYTASGDSEGSLGGLVRQGMPGRIEKVISRAIHEAKWCAADPVCIQSFGQGQYGGNLAACHNCALLPETSCENKNMLLDRGLMIGTLDDISIGFFYDYE